MESYTEHFQVRAASFLTGLEGVQVDQVTGGEDLLKGNLRFDLKDLTSKSSLNTLCTVLFPSPLAPGEPSPSC